MQRQDSHWESLRLQGAAVIRWWWVLIVTVAGGAAGLGIDALPSFTGDELDVPVWVWVLVAVAGLPIAQFLAFHDVRARLNAKIEELSDELATPDRLTDLLTVEWDPRPWKITGEAGSVSSGKYLSIKCTNRGDWGIAGCSARLERLEYWVPESSRWIEPDWFSPLLLSWSYNDEGGSHMKIGVGSNRSFDVVAYQGDDATEVLIIAAEHTLRDMNRLQFGRWRMTFNIEADECLPLALQVTMVWEPTEPRNLEFIEELTVPADVELGI